MDDNIPPVDKVVDFTNYTEKFNAPVDIPAATQKINSNLKRIYLLILILIILAGIQIFVIIYFQPPKPVPVQQNPDTQNR